jgi:hypothetical protein
MSVEETVVAEASTSPVTEQPAADTTPAAADAKPAEVKVDEKAAAEKKTEQLKAARLAEQLKKEKKFRDQQSAWQKQQDEAKKALETEREQIRKDLSEVRAANARARQVIEDLQKDPIGFLRDKFGIGPEQYYARVRNDGKPDPQELTSRELMTLKKELAEQKEWRSNWEKTAKEREEAAKKAAEEQERARQQEQYVARQQAAQEQFFDFLSQNESEYAELLLYPSQILADRTKALVEGLIEERGKDEVAAMSYKDIADILNETVSGWHSQIESARSKRKAPPNVASEQPAGAAKQEDAKPVVDELEKAVAKKDAAKIEKSRRGSVRTATTLSGENATRTSVSKKPDDFEEAKRRLKYELEAEAASS